MSSSSSSAAAGAAGAASHLAHPSQRNPSNPVVFFDVSVGGHACGRVTMELHADRVPRTAENFRQLCTGEYRAGGAPQGYKGCKFHRVIRGFVVQGGDFVSGDGTGVFSVYGGKDKPFADESFAAKHDRAGLLSMANSGADRNGCQFFVTCGKAEWLDGKHVVFGEVLDGMLVVRKLESVPTGKNNRPRLDLEITQCGEL